MGGMRRSKTTGTLVILSDHTKGLYDDKWYGDEFHSDRCKALAWGRSG